MRFKIRWFLSLLFLLAAGCLLTCYLFLKAHVQTPEFRLFAEKKLGEILKAEVKIDKIRVRFFNRVELSGVKLATQKENDQAYQIQVNQIVFQYRLKEILTRDFQVPSRLELKSPQFVIRETGFPYQVFQGASGTPAQLLKMNFDGGKVRFALPGLGTDLVLTGIKGSLNPSSEGEIEINIDAEAEGFLAGRLGIRGTVSPSKKSHRLTLTLKEMKVSKPISFPLEKFNGQIRWENDDWLVDGIDAKFHGRTTHLRGRVLRFSQNPLIDLEWSAGKSIRDFYLKIKANLENGLLIGNGRFLDQENHIFRGKIRRNGFLFSAEDLIIDENLRGKAELDFQSSSLLVLLEKGDQRLFVNSNLNHLNFKMQLKLDHVRMLGLDLVTFANISLNAVSTGEEAKDWKFKGGFETDYFILQYAPFDDFKGEFEFDQRGVRNLTASWGKVFQLEGTVALLFGRPQTKLAVKVDRFDLSQVKSFASKPLSKSIGGILEGKLKIEGDLQKPEVIGEFNIKDGWIGRLQYDLGLFRFRGFPPYLPLHDSRILKGRMTVYLTGALDFSLANVFHGVQMETADKIILWRGWEFNTSQSDKTIEINSKFDHWPDFVVKTKLSDTSNLPESLKKDNEKEETFVGAGPKLKF